MGATFSFLDFTGKKDALNSLLESIPELRHLEGCPQNPKYHYADVWEHTKDVVMRLYAMGEGRNNVLMFAGLLHDAGKGLPGIRSVNKEGQPSDIGHEKASAEMAVPILLRVAPYMTSHEICTVRWLIACHMKLTFPIPDKNAKAVRFARQSEDWLAPKGIDTGIALTWLLKLYDADMRSTVFGLSADSNSMIDMRVRTLALEFSRALCS